MSAINKKMQSLKRHLSKQKNSQQNPMGLPNFSENHSRFSPLFFSKTGQDLAEEILPSGSKVEAGADIADIPPWSKYMANSSPKGRLIEGLYKPIHGNCCHLLLS